MGVIIGEMIECKNLDLSKINTNDHGSIGGWNLIDNNKEEARMEYCKKPVVVEAFQYDGDLMNSNGEYYVPSWTVNAYKDGILYYDSITKSDPPCELFIKTVEGTLHVSVNDYIIKENDGTLYPCHSDVFESTYNKVPSFKADFDNARYYTR